MSQHRCWNEEEIGGFVGYTCLPFATIALRRRQRADLSHCASSKANEIAAHFIWMHVAIVAVTRVLFAAEAVKFRVKVVLYSTRPMASAEIE
jgi:hypothetical protein